MNEEFLIITKENGYELHASLFHVNEQNLVIICHGGLGDRYEHGRFQQAAKHLVENGFDVLLFDFSGYGKNERIPISISKMISDLLEVWNWATQKKYRKISTIGLSLGGLVSLCTPLPERVCAVFWSPAFNIQKSVSPLQVFLARLRFAFTSKPMKQNQTGAGPPLIFTREFIDEIVGTKTDNFLKDFNTPALIIQGTEDKTVKPESNIAAFKQLPKDKNHILKLVDGAPHSFEGKHLDEFIKHSLNFLKENLK